MNPLLPFATTLVLVAAAQAQMEKRVAELFELERFRAAAPALGTVAPDLVLTDLEGRAQALSALRGRVVVLIKGGFT